MEISSSQSQSLAVAAYATQQQQQVVARERERDNEAVDGNRATEGRRGDNVSFSSEALQLSGQDNRSTVVNQANAGEAAGRQQQQQQQQLAANPELGRAAGANTVAQAINAYRDTSII